MSVDQGSVLTTENAHAKVNLTLHVGHRGADGYHRVNTVLHMLSLHDTVRIRATQSAGLSSHQGQPRLTVDVVTDSTELNGTRDNLAGRAVALIEREIIQAGYTHVEVHIEKRIPIAAGLAGGSADAAAVLRGLTSALSLPLTEQELLDRAARLGSDVPACLLGGTAHGVGRGERVSRLPGGQFWWVLANPGGRLTAKEVYDALAEKRASTGMSGADLERVALPQPFLHALAASDPAGIAPFLHNDLQETVCTLNPEVASILEKAKTFGFLACLVSGSGPTIVALAKDAESAAQGARKLKTLVPWVWWGPSEVRNGAS